MTVHALQTPGSGGQLSPAEGRQPNLNAPPFQANVTPDIHPPPQGLVAPEPVRGCHVQPKDFPANHSADALKVAEYVDQTRFRRPTVRARGWMSHL